MASLADRLALRSEARIETFKTLFRTALPTIASLFGARRGLKRHHRRPRVDEVAIASLFGARRGLKPK